MGLSTIIRLFFWKRPFKAKTEVTMRGCPLGLVPTRWADWVTVVLSPKRERNYNQEGKDQEGKGHQHPCQNLIRLFCG